ncbi:MAG: T9SS type A sorting domain-containing protein [Saprospiraceae bacterium]|nr:T9SS type A sorting domain-containing protein [Saprospiraceae bacterium]
MKIIIRLFALCFICILLFMSNETGALPENTGAPGELTCGRAPCHNIPSNIGAAQIAITFNNGIQSYLADSLHHIKINITNPQTNKNGFQILALNDNRQNVGTWVLTEPTKMQIINGIGLPNRFYVTHREAGNRQTEWQLQWKAPNNNVGKVTFYVSVLASNDNGTNQGDQLYNTSIAADFALPTATKEQLLEQAFNVFPTIASDVIFIENKQEINKIPSILVDNKGAVVLTAIINFGINQLDVSHLSSGIYFLQLKVSGTSITKKIIIY